VNRALARAGVAAADALLKTFFGLAPLRKAPSILTPVGFDRVVLQLLLELQRETGATTQAALTGFLDKLDRDWPGLPPAARSKALAEAGSTYLGMTEALGPKVADAVKRKGPTIFGNTRGALRLRDNIDVGVDLNAADQRVLDASAAHQALFVRDQFGTRSARYSQIARDVVSAGLEDGLDRYDIGDRLAKTFIGTDAKRNDSYWQLIASTFTARARAYGVLSGFGEAGIDTFQFESVLDERTSEVCRFMHGRTFSTAKALDRFGEVEASEDPEEVKTLQPWGSVGKDDEGNRGIFVGSGERRKLVADVESSGAGTQSAGKYRARASNAQLEDAGFSSPPLHGHCRSTIIPVF
jgi:hypothetical protein